MKLYGTNWRHRNQIDVEVAAIKYGGRWSYKGEIHGEGLFHHYKTLQSLLWPWKKWDKWSLMILENLITRRLTVLAGPASSTKTHNVGAFVLTRYFCFPNSSCTLVSSTDTRSLELRIWGEIKKLWNEAKARWDNTPGRMVESKQMLVTDNEYDEATDYRNGILGIPCMVGGTFVGLGKYVGIKSGNLFLAADEAPMMPPAFYDAISNLSKNKGFQVAAMGNPHDRMDTFGKLAEPSIEAGGWEKYEPTGKTYVFPTRFPDGIVIQLDGRDSPNNDAAPGEPYPFPYIINRDDIKRDIDYYGEDSIQVSMMDFGIFPKDAQARRVLTRTMIERFRAQEEPIWAEETLTKVIGIDAAYGAVGGDRCVGVEMHFGKCTDGMKRIAFAAPPFVIPVRDSLDMMPEDQIVLWLQNYCLSAQREIEPSHVGLDSTGRGSLVAAFGRVWSNDFHAIEFGGAATDRPVSVKDPRPSKLQYFNFVTELWFAVSTAVQSDQVRGMPGNVMEEGCLRGWDYQNKRIQVEPKDKMKIRGLRSPDLFDAVVCALEVARRLGFDLGNAGLINGGQQPRWLEDLDERQRSLRKSKQLAYR